MKTKFKINQFVSFNYCNYKHYGYIAGSYINLNNEIEYKICSDNNSYYVREREIFKAKNYKSDIIRSMYVNKKGWLYIQNINYKNINFSVGELYTYTNNKYTCSGKIVKLLKSGMYLDNWIFTKK